MGLKGLWLHAKVDDRVESSGSSSRAGDDPKGSNCSFKAFDVSKDEPEKFDIEMYRLGSLEELAEKFVDEGTLGQIPEFALGCINYDSLAHDLGMEYRILPRAGTQEEETACDGQGVPQPDI